MNRLSKVIGEVFVATIMEVVRMLYRRERTEREAARGQDMKKIEAVIRPQCVEAVKEALLEIGHRGVTVLDGRGHGMQQGISQKWRGEDYVVDLLPKSVIIAVVHDHQVHECVEVITEAARTGRLGDGKIFVTPVDEVIRIRTGETGVDAL
jgi:nitrogen regulatory protein P-II 1